MIGLLLPFWNNLDSGAAAVEPAVVVRGTADALPLTVQSEAEVVANPQGVADALPLTVSGEASVVH